MYPVDSIYISTNSTSPASLYGGSWERYGTGRALISASDTDNDFKAGTTGGSKTHNHKYGITVGSFYGHSLIAPNDSYLAVWSGLVSYDKDSGERGTERTIHSSGCFDCLPTIEIRESAIGLAAIDGNS